MSKTLVIALEGGLISAIATDDPAWPFGDVIVIDYDTDSGDTDDLTMIDGAEAYVTGRTVEPLGPRVIDSLRKAEWMEPTPAPRSTLCGFCDGGFNDNGRCVYCLGSGRA